MTTDTLNHACSLKEEIDRLNELIERVKEGAWQNEEIFKSLTKSNQ